MKTWTLIFAIAGVLALGYCGFELVRARLYQAQEMRRFASERRPKIRPAEIPPPPQSPTTVERPYPSIGSVVAMLSIARLGMATVVVEGAEERELKLGPGHIRGTALPGDGGNVGVAGHRDTFFRPLRLIRGNDTVKVTTLEREFEYKVISTEIVEPRGVRVLYPAGHETLTLVTCYPFNFVGAAPQRFIVRADCVNCSKQQDYAESK